MLMLSAIRTDAEYRQLQGDLSRALGGHSLPFAACGLCEGAADAFMLALVGDLAERRRGAPVLAILSEEKECLRMVALAKVLGLRAAFFEPRDLTFYDMTASHEAEHRRIRVLYGLLENEFDIVFTTPDAALSFTLAREKLRSLSITLDMDSVVDTEAFAARLVHAGYVRVDMVEGAGQFAIRGGILDIYPPYVRVLTPDHLPVSGSMPVRIELFGDEVDRMGVFDIESQRVHTVAVGCEFPPAREVPVDDATRAALETAVKARLSSRREPEAIEKLKKELEDIRSGAELRFVDKYLKLVNPEGEGLLSYLEGRVLVMVRGTNAVNDRLKASSWHRNQAIELLLEEGTVSSKYTEYAMPDSALSAFLDGAVTLHIDSIAEGLTGKRLAGLYGFRSKHTVAYGDRYELLYEDLDAYVAAGFRVVVSAAGEAAAKNLVGVLSEHGYAVRLGGETLPEEREIAVLPQAHTAGFELPAPRVALLSMAESTRNGGLDASGAVRRAKKKKDSGRAAILSYADLAPGDLVVHEAHGIGRYMGLETLTIDGVTRDYVSIQYAGTDKLFLPCDRLDAVSKYIGAHADDGLVKLSRFGGGEWKKAKARAKAAVKDMAKDLIKLYAERERRQGFAFPPDDDYQRDFEVAFEYSETDGQLAAAAEIKADMESSTPMDRLLCGDVGFGKTEVALRAAYKAVLAGKQVAILVPTTILALQHFQTIQSRMRAFAVQVDMISRFRTAKQQSATLRRLARGDVDIIVGTHRLISSDVKFKDLGLLIIDEEQRFGVAQKEKIKQMTGNVDVLTLTATPIPRTLNMAMSGIRDISVLDEAPGDRLPVQTYVLEQDERILEEAMRRELRRGGQVFYLHNSVEGIHEVAATIAHAIPEARITVAHGQMEKEQLERIWSDMVAGEIDILVSTTIIETGIDVPNANTLIVDHAHRLGLSQLHQIRGRVGRSPRRAYAYFTYPRGRALGDIQRKRLEALREYAEFGAGFRIALRDLELRGAGNLLGAEQHGHLDAVGYDLYVKLLNEAVLTERGETVVEKPECVVSLSFDACLPDSYVRAPSQRIALYKRIALIETPEDLDDMRDELLDRYGELPRAAENLLMVALIRSLARAEGLTQIRQDGSDIALISPDINIDIWMELSALYPGRLRMMLSSAPYIRYHIAKGEDPLAFLAALFLKYKDLKQNP